MIHAPIFPIASVIIFCTLFFALLAQPALAATQPVDREQVRTQLAEILMVLVERLQTLQTPDIRVGIERGGSVVVALVNITAAQGTLDWGDGTREVVGQDENSVYPTQTHQYRRSGTYQVTFTSDSGTRLQSKVRVRL